MAENLPLISREAQHLPVVQGALWFHSSKKLFQWKNTLKLLFVRPEPAMANSVSKQGLSDPSVFVFFPLAFDEVEIIMLNYSSGPLCMYRFIRRKQLDVFSIVAIMQSLTHN